MELVKVRYKIRCEMGACKNFADYSVKLRRVGIKSHLHFCTHCLATLNKLITENIPEDKLLICCDSCDTHDSTIDHIVNNTTDSTEEVTNITEEISSTLEEAADTMGNIDVVSKMEEELADNSQLPKSNEEEEEEKEE